MTENNSKRQKGTTAPRVSEAWTPFRRFGLWWALVLLWVFTPSADATRVALLIGNQAYTHERVLRNPVNDAELLGRVLLEDLKFDDVRIVRNVSVTAMDREIDAFAARARNATVAVVYFSGHGMRSDGDTFLLPVDANTGAPGAPALFRQAVSARQVRERIAAAGPQTALLILDACRDGPGAGRSGSKGLGRIGGGNGLLVAYATEEGKIAQDGEGRNSPYAEALASAWRQPGKTILEQFDYVYDRVTARYSDQRPDREGNLRANARLSPFAPVTPEDERRMEDEAWELAKRLNTLASYQAYLASYPQGRYAAAARVAIAGLQPVPVPTPDPTPAPVVAGRTPGEAFRDCADCPEMVVVGTGSFVMGSPDVEAGRETHEGPQRTVRIERAFALGRTEVTVGQWRRFVRATGHVTEAEAERNGRWQGCAVLNAAGNNWEWPGGRNWRDPGFAQDDSHPVVCVSWNDVQAYVQWLSRSTGQTYRLPSEAEWEYAARAGTQSSRPWGEDPNQACRWGNVADQTARRRFRGLTIHECDDRHLFTAPVGTYGRNAFGLQDMIGNVWEWVQDCYHRDAYGGRAPSDGRAYEVAGCSDRVLRGGSWFFDPVSARSAFRGGITPDYRIGIFGFRLARMIP